MKLTSNKRGFESLARPTVRYLTLYWSLLINKKYKT